MKKPRIDLLHSTLILMISILLFSCDSLPVSNEPKSEDSVSENPWATVALVQNEGQPVTSRAEIVSLEETAIKHIKGAADVGPFSPTSAIRLQDGSHWVSVVLLSNKANDSYLGAYFLHVDSQRNVVKAILQPEGFSGQKCTNTLAGWSGNYLFVDCNGGDGGGATHIKFAFNTLTEKRYILENISFYAVETFDNGESTVEEKGEKKFYPKQCTFIPCIQGFLRSE